MTDRIFGEIPGVQEGHLFASRDDLSASGVHRPRQAGISGSQNEGADSIVLSGGYVDDEDLGDVIIYTGHGGRDPDTARQVSDQVLKYGNKALAKSCADGWPVRVVRGFKHRSLYSPQYGYSYDGLYRVESYWREAGKDGYNIWRFRLEKIGNGSTSALQPQSDNSDDKSDRTEITIQRIIRDTAQAKAIKAFYDFRCQVCDTRLVGSAGPYAEAAHIRPLGRPHNGTDTPGNILCLCPNHHVLLDYGGFTIGDDFELIGIKGSLTISDAHVIDVANVRYHRQHFYGSI